MSYRSAELAVQPETRRLLHLVNKLYPIYIADVKDGSDRRQIASTPDARGDYELYNLIKERYPKVLELQRKLNAIEAEAIKEANPTEEELPF